MKIFRASKPKKERKKEVFLEKIEKVPSKFWRNKFNSDFWVGYRYIHSATGWNSKDSINFILSYFFLLPSLLVLGEILDFLFFGAAAHAYWKYINFYWIEVHMPLPKCHKSWFHKFWFLRALFRYIVGNRWENFYAETASFSICKWKNIEVFLEQTSHRESHAFRWEFSSLSK